MEVPELEHKCSMPMAARNISADGLGGDADAGQDAEAAPPPVAAYVDGRPGFDHELEGTRFFMAAYPKGPCWTQMAVQLGGVAARAPPQLDGDAGVTTHEPPGHKEITNWHPCASAFLCERTRGTWRSIATMIAMI